MPLFENLPGTVTCYILHEEDFTFPKVKEELAVKIRSEYLPKIRELLRADRVYFDKDGDIAISAVEGTSYLTESSVFFITKAETIASITEGRTIGLISAVLCELLKARSFLQATRYTIRFSLSVEDVALKDQELESYLPASASKLSGKLGKISTNKARFKWSVNWSEGELDNEFEFDARGDKFVMGYARRCTAEKFTSFNEFVTAANVPNLLGSIKHFLEPFIADR